MLAESFRKEPPRKRLCTAFGRKDSPEAFINGANSLVDASSSSCQEFVRTYRLRYVTRREGDSFSSSRALFFRVKSTAYTIPSPSNQWCHPSPNPKDGWSGPVPHFL